MPTNTNLLNPSTSCVAAARGATDAEGNFTGPLYYWYDTVEHLWPMFDWDLRPCYPAINDHEWYQLLFDAYNRADKDMGMANRPELNPIFRSEPDARGTLDPRTAYFSVLFGKKLKNGAEATYYFWHDPAGVLAPMFDRALRTLHPTICEHDWFLLVARAYDRDVENELEIFSSSENMEEEEEIEALRATYEPYRPKRNGQTARGDNQCAVALSATNRMSAPISM